MQLGGQFSKFSEGWRFTESQEEVLLGSSNIESQTHSSSMDTGSATPSLHYDVSQLQCLPPLGFSPEIVQVTSGQT